MASAGRGVNPRQPCKGGGRFPLGAPRRFDAGAARWCRTRQLGSAHAPPDALRARPEGAPHDHSDASADGSIRLHPHVLRRFSEAIASVNAGGLSFVQRASLTSLILNGSS